MKLKKNIVVLLAAILVVGMASWVADTLEPWMLVQWSQPHTFNLLDCLAPIGASILFVAATLGKWGGIAAVMSMVILLILQILAAGLFAIVIRFQGVSHE